MDKPAPAPKTRKPNIEILDPAVAAGEWTWNWTPKGLRFRGKRPK